MGSYVLDSYSKLCTEIRTDAKNERKYLYSKL